MRVLYIAQYYSEEMRRKLNLGFEFSPAGMNKILSFVSFLGRDHQVTVLSTSYSRSARLLWLRRKTERLTLDRREVPVIYPAYPAFRFFSFPAIACSLFVECLRKRPDIVMFYNFRPETLGPAWLAKLFLGARIVCQFEDGLHVLYGRFSLRRRVFRALYHFGKRVSDGLTLVNSALLEEFPGKDAVVIPFVLPDADRVRSEPKVFSLNRQTPVRVAYTGTLDRERGADIFVEAARMLESNPRLQFYITGRGPLFGGARQKACRPKNLTCLGLLSESEFEAHLRSMDILVNPQRLSHPFSRYSFPSKVMKYILLNKPIVSTAFPDISGAPAPGLFFFRDDDPGDLARVLAGVAGGEIKVDYRCLFERFSEEKSRQALVSLFRRLSPGR